MNKRIYISAFIFFIIINSFLFSDDAISLFEKGKEEYFFENYDKAVFYLKKALDINPNYVDAMLELSHLYNDIEVYDYAYKYILKANKLKPKDNEIIVFSADLEIKLKMYNIAEKKLKNILSKDPLNIDAQNNLANLYLQTNRSTLAKKILSDILKTDPKNFHALLLTARYYELNNNLKNSKKYYKINIEQNSLNPDSFFYYSIYNFHNNEIEDALLNIKTAIQLKDRIKYKKYLGKYFLYLNKGDEALNIFKEIIKKEKDNYLNYYYLSIAYFLISDYNQSIISLKKVSNLRDDDEVSAYFFNYILINYFPTDNKERKKRSNYFLNKAYKTKNDSLYEQYISLLKESINLFPKNVTARIKLAEHFLFLKLPERYIKELEVAAKYTDDKNIDDKIQIEKDRISYRLSDDWKIEQYSVSQDIYKIPIFINREIENMHYDIEKIFLYILKNNFSEKMRYELELYSDKLYQDYEKMNISKNHSSPFYMDVKIEEHSRSIETTVYLYNSINNELIKKYKTTKNGNDKLIKSALYLLEKINNDLIFRGHILKISKDRALINCGRRSGIKLKDKLIILKNRNYLIEFSRATFVYNSDDIKGKAIVVKIDENISEIKFIDDYYFPDIDIDDIIILNK